MRFLVAALFLALAGAWLIFYTYSHFQAQKELDADEALSAVYKSPLANPTKAQPDSASLLKVAFRLTQGSHFGFQFIDQRFDLLAPLFPVDRGLAFF